MFERWKIKDFAAGEGLAGLSAATSAEAGWIDATLPGDTYLALAAAGRSGHPYAGRVENDVAWVGDREWCWRSEFVAPPAAAGERLELVFEGLDTFAAIYLNGELLGRADNMFRPWTYDVSSRLRATGPNSLAIVFAPATQSVAGKTMALWPIGSEKTAISKRNFIRKAQFGWGWDWGPFLPTVGPWLPVRLERISTARATNLHFATLALKDRQASVRIAFDVEHAAPAGLTAELKLVDPAGIVVAQRQWPAQAHCSVTLEVPDAELWWTADLGAQPLYTLQVRLLDGDVEIDASSRQVGIRTINLDTSPDGDEPGTEFFRFILNGVAIFARGANWIPVSSFVGTIDEPRYTGLIRQAVAANMNMLRVWGGGIYEHELFYELCDRHGLLVWQDFMFACAPYPQDEPAFVDSVRAEAEFQIRRLRNHPSLALWCGNNECQVIHDLVGQLAKVEMPLQGALYYDQILPDAVAQLDPQTPYWPGSPFGGGSPNSMRAGDVHNWTVWHGIPLVPDKELVGGLDRSPAGVAYTRYAEDQARFISEFGIQSAPSLATLKRWMDPADLNLASAGFIERIKDEPKDKVNAMLIPVTGLPETLEQYIDFTMLTQAEGLKFGVEHFRRRKPHCSGTLIWQLNDCWPCISWSLVDYDGVGKSSYYATARAYAPVLASFKSLGDGAFELWITNDSLQAVAGEAIVDLVDFQGAEDWRVRVPYSVAANSSAAIWSGRAAAATDRVLCVSSAQQQFASNRFLLAPVKDLQLQAGAAPAFTVERQSPCELRVTITATSYLLAVQLISEQISAQYSDNFFDLRAGESRTIVVSDPDRGPLSGHLEVRCWNQTIAV